MVLVCLYGLCAGALLLGGLRPYWGELYSNDPAIENLVYRTLPVMFFYLAIDSPKCVTLNVLRSTGRPVVTVVGNVLGNVNS